MVLIYLCLLLLLPDGNANPSNVMVGDLTFERPDNWTWVAPAEGSAVATRFVITEESTSKAGTEARFYLTDRRPQSTIENWKTYFPEPAARANAKEERTTLGGRKIVWFTIKGTYVYPKSPSRRDHVFFAALIPVGEKFIIARLGGPGEEAEKAMPVFRKMIEDALVEAEE